MVLLVGFIISLCHSTSVVGIQGKMGFDVFSATCQFAIFIAPVDREAATRHVYGDQMYRFWFDAWCYSPPFQKRHALPH